MEVYAILYHYVALLTKNSLSCAVRGVLAVLGGTLRGGGRGEVDGKVELGDSDKK